MAFIPIHAKADISTGVGAKKGKITPAQAAQLNAWCLASKTGILDCLDRCEAENLSYSVIDNYATIVFKRGYIVICGRLIECENGTKAIIQALGEVSGKVILTYNLAGTGVGEFNVGTTMFELRQNDLNENPQTGIYEFELYSYKATPTSVTLTRTQPYVPDIGGEFKRFEKSLKDEGKPLHGYDDSKGTIEERLTALGFKLPVFANVNTTYVDTGYYGFTEGNITCLRIPTKSSIQEIENVLLASISNVHLPKQDLIINYNDGQSYPTIYTLKFTTTGRLELSYVAYGYGSSSGPSRKGEIVIIIYNGEQNLNNELSWYITMI